MLSICRLLCETASDKHRVMAPIGQSVYIHVVLSDICEPGDFHVCLMFDKHNSKPSRLTKPVSITFNWEK